MLPQRADAIWQSTAERVQLEWNRATKVRLFPETDSKTILPKLVRGDPREKIVALTFDDGPHKIWTEKLLDLLQREKVKATFFVVGEMVEKNPALALAIVHQGHEIGNHSFSHVTLSNLSKFEMEVEWRSTNEVIQRSTGVWPKVCRPPGGRYNDDVIDAAHRSGMTTVLWTDDPGDYENMSVPKLISRTMPKIRNGANILLHSGIKSTLEMLPMLIKTLRDEGYKFVTSTELAESLRDYTPPLVAKTHRKVNTVPTNVGPIARIGPAGMRISTPRHAIIQASAR